MLALLKKREGLKQMRVPSKKPSQPEPPPSRLQTRKDGSFQQHPAVVGFQPVLLVKLALE